MEKLYEIVTKVTEEVAGEVCEKLCKYHNAEKEDGCLCEYERLHGRGACPLDRLL